MFVFVLPRYVYQLSLKKQSDLIETRNKAMADSHFERKTVPETKRSLPLLVYTIWYRIFLRLVDESSRSLVSSDYCTVFGIQNHEWFLNFRTTTRAYEHTYLVSNTNRRSLVHTGRSSS